MLLGITPVPSASDLTSVILVLQAAGLSAKKALTVGISVDHRRRNKSIESLQTNVQRLKAYSSKLVVLSKKNKDAPAVAQVLGKILPIKASQARIKARVITEEERKANVFWLQRKARADARFVGVRAARALAKASEAPKKEKAEKSDE